MKTKLEELVEWIEEFTAKNKFTEPIWHKANKLIFEEKEEHNTTCLDSAIKLLVKLAKSKYGDYQREFIGYKVGNYWWEGWEWDNEDLTTIITQEQMQSLLNDDKELNNIVGIDIKELYHLLETNLEYYNFNDDISIRRCYKVNKGWKIEFISILNKIN